MATNNSPSFHPALAARQITNTASSVAATNKQFVDRRGNSCRMARGLEWLRLRYASRPAIDHCDCWEDTPIAARFSTNAIDVAWKTKSTAMWPFLLERQNKKVATHDLPLRLATPRYSRRGNRTSICPSCSNCGKVMTQSVLPLPPFAWPQTRRRFFVFVRSRMCFLKGKKMSRVGIPKKQLGPIRTNLQSGLSLKCDCPRSNSSTASWDKSATSMQPIRRVKAASSPPFLFKSSSWSSPQVQMRRNSSSAFDVDALTKLTTSSKSNCPRRKSLLERLHHRRE